MRINCTSAASALVLSLVLGDMGHVATWITTDTGPVVLTSATLAQALAARSVMVGS